MRATTLRRAIVFGVCVLGIGALYLAPSRARSPDQIGTTTPPRDAPTTSARPVSASKPRPQVTATITATAIAPAEPSTTDPLPTGDTRTPAAAESDEPEAPETADPTSSRPSATTTRTGATAVDPNQPVQDDTPPAPVPKIKLTSVTPDHLTIRWEAAEDNIGVSAYRVWLNGFPVADTRELQATVDWFNDDGGQHVVQVRALDAAGNQSEESPNVLVTRPESPSPTPEPTPTPIPVETPVSPSPTPEPDPPTTVPETAKPSSELELPSGSAVGTVRGATG